MVVPDYQESQVMVNWQALAWNQSNKNHWGVLFHLVKQNSYSSIGLYKSDKV